jgi:hypothetical protein
MHILVGERPERYMSNHNNIFTHDLSQQAEKRYITIFLRWDYIMLFLVFH